MKFRLEIMSSVGSHRMYAKWKFLMEASLSAPLRRIYHTQFSSGKSWTWPSQNICWFGEYFRSLAHAVVLVNAFWFPVFVRSLAQPPLEVFFKIDCPVRYAISHSG
jgi:hypothetical protein